MLPRSPFKIRKLIPQKKIEDASPEDFEGSYFYHDEDEMDTLSKIKTWRPPKGLMKRSKPSIDIRRSEDLHKIICIPPLPDTPQSSTSSLCSYDNATGYVVSPRSSPPRRPERSPLASPRASPQRSPQRSPLLLPEQLDESPQLLPRGRSPVSAHSFRDYPQLTPPSSPPQHAEMFPEAPIIRQDVFAPTAPAIGSEPTRVFDITPARTPAGEGSKPFSQDVMQLIEETEQAFKAQPSFSNAKLSDPQLAKFPKPKQPSPLSPVAVARRKSQRRSQGSGSVRSSKSVRSVKSVKSAKSPTKATAAKATVKSPLSPAQARLPPVQPRLPATARPKRAKSKKTRRRPAARQSSLFQLTESAKDLFTIRIFHRLEADEMLPESTLREIRMSRAAQWTQSPELGVTHVDKKNIATTPIEPLDLDESAKGSATPRASVTNKGSETSRDESHVQKAQTTQEQANGVEQAHEPERHEEEFPLQQPDSPTAGNVAGDEAEGDLPIMILEDEPIAPTASAAAPQPPKPPMHRRLPSRTLPPLPTIPEIMATGPDEAVLSPTSTPLPLADVPKANIEDYIYLKSTLYTLNHSGFMHGPIKLAKADLPISSLAAKVDDTLDWTAFQMAIIGGAGDFFSEPTDYSRPSEAELDELDDLYSWFQQFGFETAGALITTPERRSRSDRRKSENTRASHVPPRTPGLSPSSNTSTPNSSPRTVGGGQRSPGIVRIDPPASDAEKSGYVSNSIAGRVLTPPEFMKHRRSVSSGIQVAPSSFSDRNHGGLAIDSARRPSTDSMASLPQSPMMELVLTHDINGNEVPVPMGFNMSHDARDFLYWNTEHVFTSTSPH